ncbi:MAG: alpha/beta hydrolase fold domain-containing protein, partial [Planctomycetota bacterium]
MPVRQRPNILISRCLIVAFSVTLLASPLVSQEPKQNPAKQTPSVFDGWDKNNDGFVTRSEFPTRLPQRNFSLADANKDGKISRKEDSDFRSRLKQQPKGWEGANLPKLPEGTVTFRNLIYEIVGDRELPLDLYIPKHDKPLPLVIWIHGGGWKSGSKNGINRCRKLLEHGYALASVEYRLSGEAIFPAAVEDCKAAVSFLRLNAKKYQLDPKRFGAWGSSAGGHLVAMLGTTSDGDDFDTHPVCKQASSSVQAVCNYFGPSDFLRMNDIPGKIDHDADDSPESLFLGGPIQ